MSKEQLKFSGQSIGDRSYCVSCSSKGLTFMMFEYCDGSYESYCACACGRLIRLMILVSKMF